MRTLTGIQPTNTLHIGNLLGALKPAVDLQDGNSLYMMIADYHAITVPQNPAALRDNILFITAAYLAAGIDPSRTVIFQQSQVPAHTELGWILQTVTRMGEAERMTQFKDKSGGKEQNVSVGLFTYPILMAADILLYDAEKVPVGADQKQHVELTRDLAVRFNRDFGNTFVVPEPLIRKEGAKVMSLIDPEKKMSKSSPNAKSYISLTDDPDVITKKIKSAVTDSETGITLDDRRPGLKNLLILFALATGETTQAIADRYADNGMRELKEDLAEALVAYLNPIRTGIAEHMAHKDELARIVREGSEKARQETEKKMQQVRERIGVSL